MAGRDHLVELGRGHAEHAIAPGIVRHEAGRVRQQVANGDRGAVPGRGLHRGELRHVLLQRRVELQLAPVAQGQDRQSGHVLGHRGDPEGRPRLHTPAGFAVGDAKCRHVDEAASLDDPGGKARDMLLFGKRGTGRIDLDKAVC